MKKYSFNSIALIIWILTVYCNVSNGKTTPEHLNILYKDIRKLKRLDKERSTEIQLLKLEKDKDIQSLKSEKDKDIQSLKSEKDKEIQLLKLEIIELKRRAAPKSCAQLSLTGLMKKGKKEWIDPDGQSTGNNPIEVECTGNGESVADKFLNLMYLNLLTSKSLKHQFQKMTWLR